MLLDRVSNACFIHGIIKFFKSLFYFIATHVMRPDSDAKDVSDQQLVTGVPDCGDVIGQSK